MGRGGEKKKKKKESPKKEAPRVGVFRRPSLLSKGLRLSKKLDLWGLSENVHVFIQARKFSTRELWVVVQTRSVKNPFCS